MVGRTPVAAGTAWHGFHAFHRNHRNRKEASAGCFCLLGIRAVCRVRDTFFSCEGPPLPLRTALRPKGWPNGITHFFQKKQRKTHF